MRRWILGSAVLFTALAGGTYWFATGGLPADEPPAWLTERPFAHRGLHDIDARPENSMAAFEAAIEEGHPIELDVHLTADGEVAVIHDDDLERLAGDPREVVEVSFSELNHMRLLGSDQVVPSLSEVLDLIGGRVPVLVEVKNRGEIGPLEDAVAEELADYDGEVAVMSFNPYSVARFAETAPEIPRGQLSGTFDGENMPGYQIFLLRQLMMNWKSKPTFVAYELEALPSAGTAIQRWRGRPLLVWTAETVRSAQEAAELGDNVICDPGGLPR